MERENSTPTQLLEINLISAQNLKPPTSSLRRLQTYAILYINPSFKIRTRIDRIGNTNPTWNDKLIFKVTPEFLISDTSAVSVEIYSVGLITDPLIGTVRFLIKGYTSEKGCMSTAIGLQVRRPSGRFHGVLNLAAMLVDGGGEENGYVAAMMKDGVSALSMTPVNVSGRNARRESAPARQASVPEMNQMKKERWGSGNGFLDFMGTPTSGRNSRQESFPWTQVSLPEMGNVKDGFFDEKDNHGISMKGSSSFDDGNGNEEVSDGTESTCSSSSASTGSVNVSTVLRDWNCKREIAGKLLCGLGFQRRIHLSASSDQDLDLENPN